MKTKRWAIFVIPVVVAALLVFFAQALLMPKYMYETQEGAMIAEYYNKDNIGGNDVLFVGDCEVYENFSPVILWNEYGITSYIRGSADQLIWQTYYLMEEMYKYESPKVMVFNVLEMVHDTPESTGDMEKREAYNRMTHDGMKWSAEKWKSIGASLTKEEKENGGYLSYIFPILRFHSRWSDITEEDFRYLFHRDRVTDNGYLMQVKVNPVIGEFNKRPLVDYSFGENCWNYLYKIKELCDVHGTQLVLIKAPSLSPVWYDEWEEQIEAYAEENDLLYINFLEKQEAVGINWDEDTFDRGLHLNVYGAEKLSVYFGKILSEECKVPDRRNDQELASLWSSKTEKYEARKEMLLEEYQQELALSSNQ